MSKTKLSTAKCPNCGKEFSIKIWESLNAQLNPEENQKFLDGDFFKFTCTCGHTTDVDYPMLYNNMEKKIMIHYVEVDQVGEVAKYIRKMQEFSPFGNIKCNFRVVTSQNQLREKAIIFANDLDDRIIEIVKVYGFMQIREDYPDAEINDVLFYVDDETKQMTIEFLGSQNISMIVEKAFYNDIASKYEDILEENDDIIINGPWALEFLQEYN